MITIDQARIDAPHFPRDQRWWDTFGPVWVTATVREDGTVTLETSDCYWTTDGVIAHRTPVCGWKRLDQELTRWVGRLRIGDAVIKPAS